MPALPESMSGRVSGTALQHQRRQLSRHVRSFSTDSCPQYRHLSWWSISGGNATNRDAESAIYTRTRDQSRIRNDLGNRQVRTLQRRLQGSWVEYALGCCQLSRGGICNGRTESIEKLEDAFKHVEQGEDFAAITAWPVLVDDKAGELLEKRDPLMMLICIHYGVLCFHLHDRWWAHNFGCRLIWDLSELLHALDASWLPLTSWARSRAASVRAASVQVQLW
jgi:hypothetical protein